MGGVQPDSNCYILLWNHDSHDWGEYLVLHKENEKVVSLRNVIGKVFYKNYAFRMFSFQKARSKQYFQELCLTALCQS